MGTTLVTQRRARAGQAAALMEAAVRLFGEIEARSQARARPWLFLGQHRPDLLIVSDWADREAARRYLADSPVRPELDRLTLGEPEYRFYHELTVYEPPSGPVVTSTCTRLHCARAAMPALLSYLLEASGPALRARPGLVLHRLYQDEDRPNHFLSIRGYESIAAREATHRVLATALDRQLRARGARLTRFVSPPMADVGRPASQPVPR